MRGRSTSIVAILIGILYLFILMAPFRVFPGFSDGERTGEIYKFSYKGVLNKSWEGEMYLGGVTQTENGLVMDKFQFSIPKRDFGKSDEIIEDIKECARTRAVCTIEYSQSLKRNVWTESSDYLVTGVKNAERD